jgi:hypothetical protein
VRGNLRDFNFTTNAKPVLSESIKKDPVRSPAIKRRELNSLNTDGYLLDEN